MSFETPIGLTRIISWMSFGLQHKWEGLHSTDPLDCIKQKPNPKKNKR